MKKESDGKKECKKKESNAESLTKNEINEQNKTLKKVFIGVGVFIGVILLCVWFINSVRYFEYEDVKFSVIKEGELILYNTALPVYTQTGVSLSGQSILTERVGDYNFYLRNDPRKLEYIPFNGEILFRENMVLDVTTEELFCEGDWSLAIGNIQRLYPLVGINLLVKNESATYKPENEHMFITINKRNQTEIKQLDEFNYEINVNICEILKATEKFMVETFVKIAKREN